MAGESVLTRLGKKWLAEQVGHLPLEVRVVDIKGRLVLLELSAGGTPLGDQSGRPARRWVAVGETLSIQSRRLHLQVSEL